METSPSLDSGHAADSDWITFPGGELEGRRPRTLCEGCRGQLQRDTRAPIGRRSTTTSARAPICFNCYRADLQRARALKAAGEIDTASPARFQTLLPFEPVNRHRLECLRAERSALRGTAQSSAEASVDKRRHAQIAARHALQRIAAGLDAQHASKAQQAKVMAAAIHAMELQFPESWLPFVVSR